MTILALGLNHRTAPVAFREKIFFAANEIQKPLLELVENTSLREVAILSTCNRTEMYCETDNIEVVWQWLQRRFPNLAPNLSTYFYVHSEEAAVRHILRVACGLDSMILGEQQILGQLKQAVSIAKEVGTLGTKLDRLFQHVFATTKQVRTQTGIGNNPISLAFVALNLAKNIFADLSQLSALVIGSGETIELTLRYLQSKNINNLMIVNRTFSKAQNLAEQFNAQPIRLGDMPEYLAKADMVFTATSSLLPIIGKGLVERALKLRKRRPIFMVDLAVPRDVEAEVSELEDVYLYAMDDLQRVIAANWEQRHQSAQEAEELIELQVAYFMSYLRSLDAVKTIRTYRDAVEQIRDEELIKAKQLLTQGYSAEAAMKILARNVCNKLMHKPTIKMRQAGHAGHLELLAAARELFDIDE